MGRRFAYQENLAFGRPAGTGDAVRVALGEFDTSAQERDVYIFSGTWACSPAKSYRNFDTASNRPTAI